MHSARRAERIVRTEQAPRTSWTWTRQATSTAYRFPWRCRRQHGVIFKLAPQIGEQRWTETVLHSFCSLANCADGSNSLSGLVARCERKSLRYNQPWGTKGSNGGGVLFQVTPDGSYSVVHDFCDQENCTDGSTPLNQGGCLTHRSHSTDTSSVHDCGHNGDANHIGQRYRVRSLSGSTITRKSCTVSARKPTASPVAFQEAASFRTPLAICLEQHKTAANIPTTASRSSFHRDRQTKPLGRCSRAGFVLHHTCKRYCA